MFSPATTPNSELPVFFLTVAKSGSKLQRSVEGTSGQSGTKPSTSTYGTPVSEEIKGTVASIDQLIKLLSVRVERPIIDKTNLTGSFDFTVKFARTSVPALPPATSDSPDGPGLPDVFTAIQEQLGLKLESGKGPVEVLVIDSVEKPTPN
jgi:uncharacterized protein (TIGR03435 family)